MRSGSDFFVCRVEYERDVGGYTVSYDPSYGSKVYRCGFHCRADNKVQEEAPPFDCAGMMVLSVFYGEC